MKFQPNMKLHHLLFLLIAVVSISFFLLMPASSLDLSPGFISAAEMGYYSNHIHYNSKTPELEGRVAEQLIKLFDASKFYYLKKDVESFHAKARGILSMTPQEKFQVVAQMKNRLRKRIQERKTHLESYLGDSYLFDTNAVFLLDSDKRDYPDTTEEANKALETYLHFQVSNYLLSGLTLKEAKEFVVKSYERTLKRVEEQDTADLVGFYLDAFARSMDPHSSFLSKDVLEDFEISMRLSLEGIGAVLSSKDGFTVIQQLIAGGAAGASGKLKPGDKIIAVAQGDAKAVTVIDMDLRDVVKKIRGKAGSEVRLTILRQEGDETSRFIVTLIRTKVNLEDQAATLHTFDRFVKDRTISVGLVTLPSFYGDMRSGKRACSVDLAKVLREAKAKKVHSMVLDLSTNGGGSLEEAVKVGGLFFSTGNVVKQTNRRLPEGVALEDTDPETVWDGPLVVLVSRASASASEIVTGALKDYERALIVGGDHTFGKGSVQSLLPLMGNMGALKVTVGLYYVPGGKSTQITGVIPDIILPNAWSSEKIGEAITDYPLPADALKPFLSSDKELAGKQPWKKIKTEWIETLKPIVAKRVAANKEFTKIKEDLAKIEKNAGIVKLSDLWKEKKEAKEKGKDPDKIMSQKEIEAEYLKRADILESVTIAAELYILETGGELKK